jgi:ATP-dependent Clp protease ATP-binding subunit ClpX
MSTLNVLLYKFLIFVAVALAPIGLVCLLSFLQHIKKGDKIPEKKFPSEWSDKNILVKLFWLFPQRLVTDFFERDPDEFPMSKTGLYIFEGKQGSGKTVSACYYMIMLKMQHPALKIMSNISFTYADDHLEEWTDMVFKQNGSYGQIIFIDEIQNYFNSLESKNFPPEALQEICQQRKQRKAIFGTTQVFQRVAKPIREQTRFVVRPKTLFGCFTIMSFFDPSMDKDGQVEKMRRVKTMCFVHTKVLREAFDTFETVERHALVGFKPRSEQLSSDRLLIPDDKRGA